MKRAPTRGRACRMIAIGILVTVACLAGKANTTYTNTTGTGQWNVAANWNHGVPGPSDSAFLTNALLSGTAYTVTVADLTTHPFRITCGAPVNQELVLDVHDNLNPQNNATSDSDWGFGPKGNVTVNIHDGGQLNVRNQILGAGSNNRYVIEPGGSLAWSTGQVSKRFRVFGSLVVRGNLSTWNRGGELADCYGLVLDGGTLFCTRLTVTSSAGVTITNNASASIGEGFVTGNTWNMYSGTVTNRKDQYNLGEFTIGNAAAGNAIGTLNILGGRWESQGDLQVCRRPAGYLNVSGSADVVAHNVYAGSRFSWQGYIVGQHGYMTVSGGNLTVTNLLGLGNITHGYLTCSGGTTTVNRLVLSYGENVALAPGEADPLGRVTLSGGHLTVEQELIATNGSLSQIVFNAGTLHAAGMDVDNAAPLVIGDGESAAVLGLLTGSHRFADGLVITNNATLAAGGVGAQASPSLTGNLTLENGANLHCDFQARTGETITLAGTLNLPLSATVHLNSLDGTLADETVLVAAADIPQTDLSGWSVTGIDEERFFIQVVGNDLVVFKRPKGIAIIIR